ncbi:hypothetical protein [Corynebacterium terpenotabidum]|uniref:Uncharacterized protein n=1 Tax=Corynebacterium terpenotabidum Y-11 TaxID=1200352 RepID=S4XDG1_9CORY|nr:hypothetical protein [Corynebacterium terpenotabidum]AGP31187.1 hypothetical protein A606_07700 [Corynebacterium terpenotabidum Y-11]
MKIIQDETTTDIFVGTSRHIIVQSGQDQFETYLHPSRCWGHVWNLRIRCAMKPESDRAPRILAAAQKHVEATADADADGQAVA